MELSHEVSLAVENGTRELARNANGELILPHRRRIWRAIGPIVVKEKRAMVSIALTRRMKLAELSARRVKSIWARAFPQDEGLETVLDAAQRYLRAETDWDSAWKLKNDFWSKLDDLMNEGENFDAAYAGYAAANVVTTALNDERLGDPAQEKTQVDDELDPYQWDASYYASLSYAGGAPWEEQSDTSRRREFWTWYLTVAVPVAWGAVWAESQ